MSTLRHVSDWLRRISTTGVALAALLGFFLFSVLVLPAQSDRADAYAGEAASPDTSFLYSPQDLYDAAQTFGAQGRAAYIRSRFTFDLAWPLVYAVFLATALSWVFGGAWPAHSRWQLVNLTPVLGGVADYLENLSTSIVMARYPQQTPVIDILAPGFTALKWVLIGASFALLLGGIVVGTWRWARRRGT